MKSASRFSWVVACVVVSILSCVLVIALPGVGSAQGSNAPNPALGTWKLNLAKSTYNPGPPPRGSIRRLEPSDGGLKSTADAIDAQGKSTHTEITYKYDGKDYPLKGAPVATTRAHRRIDDRTFEFVTKVDGKVTTTTRVTRSPDGKLETGTTTGKNAQGQSVNNTTVWDRQ